MELKEGMKLSELDELLEKEGFSRKENLWFADTIDLCRIIDKIAYRIGFKEVRILSARDYLNDEKRNEIFNIQHSNQFDQYLIYVKE